MRNAANNYYKGRKGNCAQSVAAAWNERTGQNVEVGSYKEFGHGKAPEGMCGALYAACDIAGEPHAEKIRGQFVLSSGGNTVCRDIRRNGILSCAECVMRAAELLEQNCHGDN